MIKKLIAVSILFALTILSACLDEIDYAVPNEYQNSVVFQGKIVKGNPSSVELIVQNVFDFSFENGSFFNAKEVIVVNDKGQKLNVPNISNGSYKLVIDPQSGFEVDYGSSYGIEISLFDGRSYSSALEELLPVPKIDSVDQKIVIGEYVNDEGVVVSGQKIEYRVTTPLVAEVNQKRTNIAWNLERTYKKSDLIAKDQCYISGFADPITIQVVNTEGNSRMQIDNELILEQVVSRTMVEGQYISVIQESLDKRALGFWEQTIELSTNGGTFYEPPVGQIVTNFMETKDSEGDVFGFFYATEQDSFHVFVDSTYINYFIPICPHPDNVPRENSDFGPCDDCCFCLWTDNSTLAKPSFWKE